MWVRVLLGPHPPPREHHPWNLIASSATYRTEPYHGVVLELTAVRHGETTDLDVFVSPDEAEVLTGLLNDPRP